MQAIAIQLSDVFIDNKKIVKSYISATNILIKINVPIGQVNNTTANEYKTFEA